MIIRHTVGDIMSPENTRDVIIAMNTELSEVSEIGRPFVEGKVLTKGEIELGSVLTFDLPSSTRQLHMLVCHKLGVGGWKDAYRYARFGLDHLWYHMRDREFSIVTIGAGHVGQRDGADLAGINRAIADAFLEVEMYIRGNDEAVPLAVALQGIAPVVVWQPSRGNQPFELELAA